MLQERQKNMQQFKVYTATKNIDLHAVSAKEAIVQFLNIPTLSTLRRFQQWELSFDFPTHQEAEVALEKIVSKSYYLLNPNKEVYSIGGISRGNHVSDLTVIAEVKRHSEETSLRDRIASVFSVPLVSLVHSVLWEITLTDASDPVEEGVFNSIVQSTSQDKGILCNPLFEKASVISHSQVYRANE